MKEKSKDFINFSEKSLSNYLKDIKNFELLDGNSQIELVIKAKSGCDSSKEELIRANLRFVISIAREYQNNPCGLSLNDLINEGNIGLIKSIEKFDETKGVKFISYAVWWIRQAIMQSIYENSNTIKMPINKINSINKINKIKEGLFSSLMREPTAEEIYIQLCKSNPENELDVSDISIIMGHNNTCISFDAPIRTSSDDSLLLHEVVHDLSEGCEEYINLNMIRASIYDAVKTSLSHRESEILMMYFGFDRNQMTLKEISDVLGITNERVRQIKDNAIKKLRGYKHKNLRKFLKTEF